jgi:hypothetical protein
VLSCQNYDDEFASLNSKIAGLESQITSLAELRTAVTGVQSSISALQTAVAAAQAAAVAAGDAAEAAGDANAEAAAANAESIAALATSVAAIAADLVDLQTAIDGATTQADLDALKSELSTTLAALQALIETNSASITSLITSNSELKDALEELGIDVDSVLAANAAFEGNLTITNASELAYAKSLGNNVATIKGNVYILVDEEKHASGGTGTGLSAADVNSVTSLITYVVGDVKIDADAEVDLSALVSVSGDYMVLTHDVKDDALTSVGDDVFFDYDGPYTSNIETADNIYLVHKQSVTASATVAGKLGTTSINFLALKASSLQTFTPASVHTSGASINIDDTLGATNTINVAGGSSTVAASNKNTTASIIIGQVPVVSIVGGIALTEVQHHYAADYNATTNTSGSAALPSLNISAPYTKLNSITVKAEKIAGAVTIDVQKSTDTSNSGTASFASTTSITGKYTSDANDNLLGVLTTVGGLELSEQKSVTLSVLATSTGSVTLTEATSFSLPVLTTVSATGDISAPLTEGAISLPALITVRSLSFAEGTSLSAPLAVSTGTVTLDSLATSIELASAGTIAQIATIESLTLNAQRTTMNLGTVAADIDGSGIVQPDLDAALGAVALKTLTFKGYAATGAVNSVDLRIDTGNEALTSVVLGGKLHYVTVNTGAQAVTAKTTTALTSVSSESSASIHAIFIADNYDLTTANLLHKEDPLQAVGPTVTVTDNRSLTSLTTGVTFIDELTVTGNYQLSSMNFASINNVGNNITVGSSQFTVNITGNFLSPVNNAAVGATTAGTSTQAQTLANWYGVTGTYTAQTAGANRAYGQTGLATLSNLWNHIKDTYYDADPTDAEIPVLNVTLDYKYQANSTTVSTATISKASGNSPIDVSGETEADVALLNELLRF